MSIDENKTHTPTVFISYSQEGGKYQDRVTQLAKDLCSNGVDVIYDRWAVHLGDDLATFMEQGITKADYVLILCTPTYKKKADERKAGVGTETLIISPDVYTKTQQNKYIPVVMELDQDGSLCIPTYVKGRLYLDLSKSDSSGFEELLRHIFNQPLLQKPEIGHPPGFLLQENSTFYIPSNHMAIRAINEGNANLINVCNNFFDKVLESLEQYRIDSCRDNEKPFYETFLESIHQMKKVRDDTLDVIIPLVCSCTLQEEIAKLLHRLFEGLYAFSLHPKDASSWRENDFDNYRFVLYELFLYTIAAYLKYDKLEAVSPLLQDYVAPTVKWDNPLLSFWDLFPSSLISLNQWNKTLKHQWISPGAYHLQDRACRCDITWEDLIQADIFLSVKSKGLFYPWTSPHLGRGYIIPIFARATSKAYAQRLAKALGFASAKDLKMFLLDEDQSGIKQPPYFFKESLGASCNAQYIGERE